MILRFGFAVFRVNSACSLAQVWPVVLHVSNNSMRQVIWYASMDIHPFLGKKLPIWMWALLWCWHQDQRTDSVFPLSHSTKFSFVFPSLSYGADRFGLSENRLQLDSLLDFLLHGAKPQTPGQITEVLPAQKPSKETLETTLCFLRSWNWFSVYWNWWLLFV